MMSIDARVVGIRESTAEHQVKLTLEGRPGVGLAGQSMLVIENAPRDWPESALKELIGCDIWGGSGMVMLGDKQLAKRDGYLSIILVDGWKDVISQYKSNKQRKG